MYSFTGSLLLSEAEQGESKEKEHKQGTEEELRWEGLRAPSGSGSGSGGDGGNGGETPVLLLMSVKTDHYSFRCPLTFTSSTGPHNLL